MRGILLKASKMLPGEFYGYTKSELSHGSEQAERVGWWWPQEDHISALALRFLFCWEYHNGVHRRPEEKLGTAWAVQNNLPIKATFLFKLKSTFCNETWKLRYKWVLPVTVYFLESPIALRRTEYQISERRTTVIFPDTYSPKRKALWSYKLQ